MSETPRSLTIEPVGETWAKRTFDVSLSLVICFVGAPVMVLLMLLVKLSSPGPIIYSQMRVGLGQMPFQCLKFRTMYVDAEERLEKLLSESPELRAEWDSHQKLQSDPRVTRVGQWLRRSSLDELPQIMNVLRGEMSLVGPRPYLPQQLSNRSADTVRTITSVRPGLTGLWQTSGRSRLTFEQRVQLDLAYVHKQSLGRDLILILKTIPAVLAGKNAC